MAKTALYLCMALLSLLLIPIALGNIVIEQVYYDPVSTESGGEFVLLKNRGTSAVNISGWTLATGSSIKDATIPMNTFLGSGSTYLIADTGWNASKDDPDWPEADLEDTITMKNTDSGVALRDENGEHIDAVGWGAVADEGLYEGTPANATPSGKSLQRLNDTDDNKADFIVDIPRFTVRIDEGDILVTVTVVDPSLRLDTITLLEDDDPASGVQYTPYPGIVRSLPLQVHIRSLRNATAYAAIETERSALQLVQREGELQQFEGSAPLLYSVPPGLHNITFTFDDGENVLVERRELIILPLLALDIGVNELDFGTALPGETAVIRGDVDTATPAPTLRNIGNVPLHLGYEGSPLRSGSYQLNASALHFTVGANITSNGFTPASSTLDYLLDLGRSTPISFAFTIPEHAVGGTYAGTIRIVGVSAS